MAVFSTLTTETCSCCMPDVVRVMPSKAIEFTAFDTVRMYLNHQTRRAA